MFENSNIGLIATLLLTNDAEIVDIKDNGNRKVFVLSGNDELHKQATMDYFNGKPMKISPKAFMDQIKALKGMLYDSGTERY
jgi:hypothetical protein